LAFIIRIDKIICAELCVRMLYVWWHHPSGDGGGGCFVPSGLAVYATINWHICIRTCWFFFLI